MANLKSAIKRSEQAAKRRLLNQARKSEIKTLTKKYLEAVESQDTTTAQELLRLTESKIARAKGKGVFKPNTAARKVSRLAKGLAK